VKACQMLKTSCAKESGPREWYSYDLKRKDWIRHKRLSYSPQDTLTSDQTESQKIGCVLNCAMPGNDWLCTSFRCSLLHSVSCLSTASDNTGYQHNGRELQWWRAGVVPSCPSLATLEGPDKYRAMFGVWHASEFSMPMNM
jgi:hypothetical protein